MVSSKASKSGIVVGGEYSGSSALVIIFWYCVIISPDRSFLILLHKVLIAPLTGEKTILAISSLNTSFPL